MAIVHGIRVMKISRTRKSGRKNVSYIQLCRFVPTRTPDQCKTKLKNLEKRYDRAIEQSSHDSDWEEDQPYMRELISLWGAPSAPLTPDTDDDASSGTVHEFEPPELEDSSKRAIKQSSHENDWEEDQPKHMREPISFWGAPSVPSTPDTDDDASSGTVNESESLDDGNVGTSLDWFCEVVTTDVGDELSDGDLLSIPLDGDLVVG